MVGVEGGRWGRCVREGGGRACEALREEEGRACDLTALTEGERRVCEPTALLAMQAGDLGPWEARTFPLPNCMHENCVSSTSHLTRLNVQPPLCPAR